MGLIESYSNLTAILKVVNQQIFCSGTGTDRIRVESKGINHIDGWGRSRI